MKILNIGKMKSAILLTALSALCWTACQHKQEVATDKPVIDGYFADPCIVKHNDTFYIYATIDPWGGDELAVFESADLKNFERRHINWPTKEACTSPTSGDARVWAPAVVKAPDGKFYMYISVGSEIWAGVSDHPLGPWRNLKDDNSPLIHRHYFPGYHMIDADCFIDDDGQAYLYWGSGLNWVNGRCFVVKLQTDMHTFDGEPADVTPPNFFEAPFMFKKNNTYYLMYSDGIAIDPTYKVRYSKGTTPYGPWEEGPFSPILATTADSTVIGPGHHCVFTENGTDYILYHRIFPQTENYVLRQLYLDLLKFDTEGNILKIH
jgi:beta-xylosidase